MLTSSQIMARRIGRIAFGCVLIAGGLWLATAAYASNNDWTHSHSDALPYRVLGHTLDAVSILGITWLTAAIAGLVAWWIADRRRLARAPNELLAKSLMLPAAGIALILPLTLHLPVVVAISDRGAFDTWVLVSLWMAGSAHLTLAGFSMLRAHQLAAGTPAWSPGRIYGVTLLVSCIPFVLLLAIPPAIVAITGLPFIPLLRWMEGIAGREQAALALIPHVPRAVVQR
ncbi:MAG TPA: hypothetical protein VH165_01670 [Kofleriaceae bacterium]|nr:hypothetical protein [Kofleriaceae bacterium]